MTEPYRHWRDKILFWMETTKHDLIPSGNAFKQQRSEDFIYSQFKMVDGVQQALRLSRHSTDMVNRQLVSQMVRVDHGNGGGSNRL